MHPKEIKRLRKKIERKTITPEEARVYNEWATAANRQKKAGRPIKLAAVAGDAPISSRAIPGDTGGTAPAADTVNLPSFDGPPPLDPTPPPKVDAKPPRAELVVGSGHKEAAGHVVFGLKLADAYSGGKGGFAFGPSSPLWVVVERSLTRTIARHFPDLDGEISEQYDEIVVGGAAGVILTQAGWIAVTGSPPFRFSNPSAPVPGGEAPPTHAAEKAPPAQTNGVQGLFVKATS